MEKAASMRENKDMSGPGMSREEERDLKMKEEEEMEKTASMR